MPRLGLLWGKCIRTWVWIKKPSKFCSTLTLLSPIISYRMEFQKQGRKPKGNQFFWRRGKGNPKFLMTRWSLCPLIPIWKTLLISNYKIITLIVAGNHSFRMKLSLARTVIRRCSAMLHTSRVRTKTIISGSTISWTKSRRNLTTRLTSRREARNSLKEGSITTSKMKKIHRFRSNQSKRRSRISIPNSAFWKLNKPKSTWNSAKPRNSQPLLSTPLNSLLKTSILNRSYKTSCTENPSRKAFKTKCLNSSLWRSIMRDPVINFLLISLKP